MQLNHVAIHVADVEASCRFYEDVLRLEKIPRPAFRFPGAWFRLGVDQELHLIGGRTADTNSHHRGNHWALMVDDLDAWWLHIQSLDLPGRFGVAHRTPRTRNGRGMRTSKRRL